MNVPSGYTALDLVGFTDKGPYNSATAYVKNDIVHYGGNLWRCLVDDTTNVTPTEGTNWTIYLSEPTSAAEDIIAPVEASAVSTHQYAVGKQLILNDTLYRVTAAVNIGDTLAIGTNITASDTVVEQLATKANTSSLATVATSGSYADLSNKPTLGTAAAKDVPASGNASTTEVVMGDDTRLSDARNAADVYSWAKASTKPTYNGSEINTSAAQTGTSQSAVAATIASGTSMDAAVKELLDNDVTLSSQISSVNEALANETNAREAADTALGARIDNIIAPSGEAPSAAEVTDARVGADGTTYNSLGTAIRTQVNALTEGIKSTGFEGISFDAVGGYIDSSTKKWVYNATSKCVCIPINPYDFIEIVGNATNTMYYALLRSYSGVVDGTSVDLSNDSNFNTVKSLNANTTLRFNAPSDAYYLYIGLGVNNNRKPTKLVISGYDFIKDGKDNILTLISDINADFSDLDALSIERQKKLGYINTSTSVWMYDGGTYAVYSVKSGDRVIIKGINGLYIGVLKSYNPIAGSIADFSTDSAWTSVVSIADTNTHEYIMPNDAAYFYIALGNNNRFIPAILTINKYSLLDNVRNNFVKVYNDVSNYPLKIKILSYNIGKFNYGNITPQMSEELYQAKINNYREFFINSKFDFAGIEEFKEYMDEAHLHKSDEVLFDYVFPGSKQVYVEQALKSIYDRVNGYFGTFASFTYPAQKGNYVVGVFDVHGKRIAILATAFTSDRSNEAIIARQELFTRCVTTMNNIGADYSFITGDFNTDGNDDDITSYDEGNSFTEHVRSLGYDCCNNAFLGNITTAPETPMPLSCDNICWKNNGKVVYQGFKALSDAYELLSSDHYPVVGDFLLL